LARGAAAKCWQREAPSRSPPAMDRTDEFRRLIAGLGGAPTAQSMGAPAPSPFMRHAGELRRRLLRLRRELRIRGGGDQASGIEDCKDAMAVLEGLVDEPLEAAEGGMPASRRQDHHNFRHAVVQGLYEELRDIASQVQSKQMQEMRHEAEIYNLFTEGGGISARMMRRSPELPDTSEGDGGSERRLPDDSLKAEEQHLLAAFETNLDQINQVKQKLGEVATMVSVFATKAEEQHEMAEQILDDAATATQHVEEASKHLQKANDNKSSYNFYIVCWFLGSSIFLLIFDFVDARYSWI